MFELAAVFGAGLLLWQKVQNFQSKVRDQAITAPKVSEKVTKLWERAGAALTERRYKAAERALLNILKVDHTNAAAYNRLGTIYAKQQNLEDARECFEIASSLTPTLSSLYNLGLVEYELGNYQSAGNAFERVIDLEPTVQRYIAFSKAQYKLGNLKKVTFALEEALKLQKSAKLMEILAQAYEALEDFDNAAATRSKAQRLRRRGRTSTK